MTAARTETVVLSQMLSDLPAAAPAIQQTVGGPLLRALHLVPRIPAWISDPALRADILAGFVDIPDDLGGGS